jgi:hypothetical protein
MAIELEAYTAEGILRGSVVPDGRLGDLIETLASLAVGRAVVMPLEGPERRADRIDVGIDDLLIVVAPPSTPAPIHASWHELALVAGPYLLEGELPTLPGFDPGRALVRPTGTFVLLGSARVSLAASPAAGSAEHALVWVNRYTVEDARGDLELSVFFPGATTSLVDRGGRPDPTLPARPEAVPTT